MRSLFVIIPVHNRIHYTRKCLLNLEKQTFANFQTIVVDDGSTDCTSEMIRDRFPEVVVLKGDGNLWWAGGANLGIEYALKHDADYILMLNDDVEIDEGYLQSLADDAVQFPHTIIGSALFDSADKSTLVYFGEKVNWITAKNRMNRIQLLNGDIKHAVSDLLPGRGLLIPAEVFKKAGYFDARRLPMGGADHDLVWRARKFGYRAICSLNSKVYCYIDETAVAKFKQKRSLVNLYYYLFSIRSSANLKMRFYFAIKNCPKHFLPLYLPIDFIRLFGSYFKLNKRSTYLDSKLLHQDD
jgi:GT2 family glycosyltransferase